MKIFVVVATLLIGFLVGEVALRYFTIFPVTRTSNSAYDPRLGYRLSSSVPDVDSHGFRNREGTFETFEVAAIGDSHTFSHNVRSDDSWPAVFGRLTGLETYNFGVGSYNIFTYHAIFEEIIDRSPKGVIIALYLENDFETLFKYCDENGDFAFWKQQVVELQLTAPTSLEECNLEEDEPEGGRPESLFPDLAVVSAIKYLVVDRIKEYSKRSKIIVNAQIFINNLGHTLGFPVDSGGEDKFFWFPGDVPPLHKKKVRYDTGRKVSEIEPMLPNFEKLARDWKREAQLHGTKLGVMIVPSREQVIYALVEKNGMLAQTDPEFRELLDSQNRFDGLIQDVLDEIGIANVTALPEVVAAMQDALEADVNFYPARDSHPLEGGYRAYAEAAQRLWQMLSN